MHDAFHLSGRLGRHAAAGSDDDWLELSECTVQCAVIVIESVKEGVAGSVMEGPLVAAGVIDSFHEGLRASCGDGHV